MNIDRLFLWGARLALGLSVFTPLVIGPFGLTVALYPQAAFFRALVEIAFVFYIFLLYRNPTEYMPRHSLLSWSLVALVGSFLITGLTGITPFQSFWGDVQRSEGVIFFIHLLVYFFVLTNVFRRKAEWMWLLRGAAVAAAISAVIGIVQAFQTPFLFQLDPGRASGTFSNPVFFGNYMTLSVFLTLLIFLQEKKRFMKIGWGIMTLLCIVALIASGTRGAWLGLIVGVFATSALVVFFSGVQKKQLIKISVMVLAGLVLIGILAQGIPGVQEQRLFQRATQFPGGELASRFVGWSIAIDAWQERPILGWGPESFKYTFDKFFRAEYLQHIKQTTFFDRAHNQVLHLLATTGILGAGAYLFVLFTFLLLVWRYMVQAAKSSQDRLIGFSLIGYLVASFVQNMFSFDTIASWILFFLLAAFVHSYVQARVPFIAFVKRSARTFSIFLLVSYVLFASILMYQLNIKPTYVSLIIIEGAKLEQEKPLRALEKYKKGLTQKTVHDPSFRIAIVERLLVRYEETSELSIKRPVVEMLAGLKPQVSSDFKKFIRIHASGYEILFGMNEKIYQFGGDPLALEEMENIMQEAIEINPQTPRFYHLAGRAAIFREEYEEGEGLHWQAYELTPKKEEDLFEVYFQLGLSYQKIGQREKSLEYFKNGLDVRYELRKKDLTKTYQFKDVLLRTKVAAALCEISLVQECVLLLEQGKIIYPKYTSEFQIHLDSVQKQIE